MSTPQAIARIGALASAGESTSGYCGVPHHAFIGHPWSPGRMYSALLEDWPAEAGAPFLNLTRMPFRAWDIALHVGVTSELLAELGLSVTGADSSPSTRPRWATTGRGHSFVPRQRLPPLLGHFGVGVFDGVDDDPRSGVAGRADGLGGKPPTGGDGIGRPTGDSRRRPSRIMAGTADVRALTKDPAGRGGSPRSPPLAGCARGVYRNCA